MDAMREIDALVEFRGRAAGTDAERRAAEHLANRLREIGRDADVEPVHVYPNYPVTHAIHALLAIAGSVLSVSHPAVGAVLVLVAMLSALGDLTGVFYAVRRLTGRRASQNVFSRVDAGRDGTLVLVAHYDSAHSGAVFGGRVQERRAVLGKLLKRPIGLFEPFFWSIVAVLACTILRVAGIDALLLTIVQFIFTVVLIVSVPLLLDIALSDPVPGANDNASGVATVLRLAERFGYVLDHFQVCVLFTGAEEGLLGGMREWMRRHRKQLAPERTVFLNVDKVGTGTVRFTTKEGLVIASPYHPTLISLCHEIADEDDEGGRYGARGLVSRHVTDAYAARTAGFPAITISCANALDYVPEYHQHSDTIDHIDSEALDRAYGFCCELIERLDARVGADLAAARSDQETALSEEETV